MQAGIKAGVPFEVACGGNAECCTCHVQLSPELRQAPDYEEPREDEQDSLDDASGMTDDSRLACQMKVTASLDNQRIIFVGF